MSKEPTIYKTVGELKAALAALDDSLPLAVCADMGSFLNGVELYSVELKTFGHYKKDRATYLATDPIMAKFTGKVHKGPFPAILIK